MQGLWRRVIYVTLYELIAIVVVTAGLTWLTGQSAGHSGVVAVATSAPQGCCRRRQSASAARLARPGRRHWCCRCPRCRCG
ncbi:hypothetical protein ET532_027685 [Verminephrobacter sp. Larva24]|nr:hypothetical protein ET532_027685 [Verminephrobacter sp. Larva24]